MIRVGVVGVGVMGRHHARVYDQLEGCELVGVHDVDPERRDSVAAEFGVTGFTELADLLAEVDAVTIAVPTPDHYEVGLACVEAGRDLLVEKPLAPSLPEADGLIEAAGAGGSVLQVGHIERFNPAVEAMSKIVEEPRFIEVDRLGSLVPRSLETDVILDLMIHDIDIVHSLVGGEVVEIRAIGVPILTDAIDFANARLEFDNECIVNLTASRVSANRIRKVRIFQAEAYLSVDYTAQTVEHYRLVRGAGTPSRIETNRIDPPDEEPLVRQLVDFVTNCENRNTPRSDGHAGRQALQTALAIRDYIEERMG